MEHSQACKAVKPEAAEPTCQLHLEKSPTQEEFVRGHMPHNPYSSAEAGPLMRDVKNFVCRQLDMAGEPVMRHFISELCA